MTGNHSTGAMNLSTNVTRSLTFILLVLIYFNVLPSGFSCYIYEKNRTRGVCTSCIQGAIVKYAQRLHRKHEIYQKPRPVSKVRYLMSKTTSVTF